MTLTQIQKDQLAQKGISKELLLQQLERFKKGFPIVKLDRPATIGDGITSFKNLNENSLVSFYDDQVDRLDIIKFVPASGAATRMFKFLHEFLNNFDPQEDSINSYINFKKAPELFTFFIGMEKLPFYDLLISSLKKKYEDWQSMSLQSKKIVFIEELLLEKGFNYSAMPKGLVPFHKYKDHLATAFEEHLFEASIYAKSKEKAHLHFTISPDYRDHFNDEFERIENIVERKTDTSFNIDFSYQASKTDTISVSSNNEPIVLDDGTFFFRPAGHGALIENLNQLDADLIFIKNIDNVTVASYEQEVCKYKKMLAGYLLKIREKTYAYLNLLESKATTDAQQKEIETFLTEELNTVFPADYIKYAKEFQLDYLFDRLNRPIRICGMVKNEGEPGGGPFWTANSQGERSLQIVESAQMDMKNARQKSISAKATHFNPVDLICSVRNHKGKKYDLKEFCDAETGFITYKSRNGKKIKAQELPGLWNGGMAFWNTIFVEVPLITFNPVKTVNDLLKPAHQLD